MSDHPDKNKAASSWGKPISETRGVTGEQLLSQVPAKTRAEAAARSAYIKSLRHGR